MAEMETVEAKDVAAMATTDAAMEATSESEGDL